MPFKGDSTGKNAMMSGLAILLVSSLFSTPVCKSTIYGRVMDTLSGQPIERVRIGVRNGPVTRSNSDGTYRLNHVCSGTVQLRAVRTAYELTTHTLSVQGEHVVDMELKPMHVTQGEDIRVEAPRLKAADTRSVVSLEGDALLRTRGENLADALANLPGVTVLRNGTTAKPVIRGQYGSRVLKLYDGVRHEGQDWGLDHGPEIDPFAAGSMRVVKGSAGVRYGPDAIAGVLLIDPPTLLKEPGLRIYTQTIGALNGKRGTVAGRVDGRHEIIPGLSWRIDGNLSRGAGLMTPDYPLDNTGVDEQNIGGVVEYEGDCWSTKVSVRRNDRRAGACLCVRNEATSDFEATLVRRRPLNYELYQADYDIERPYQHVVHDIMLTRTRVDLQGVGTFETTYAYQVNDRREYDIIRFESPIAQYNFLLRSHTADASFQHAPMSIGRDLRLEGLVGLSGMHQENSYDGRPFLSDYLSLSGGVFALERLVLEKAEIEAGLRFDYESREAFIPEKTYESLLRENRIESTLCEVRVTMTQIVLQPFARAR